MTEDNQQPLISFIIPVLNEEKDLEATIKPLRQLSGVTKEIIVSDGGSTDNTVALARQLADKVYVRTSAEKNKSIGENRNKGAALASGKYLFFIDCQVEVPRLKELLEKCLLTFERQPKVGAFTFKINFFPKEQKFSDSFFLGIINFAVWLTNKLGISGLIQAIGWAQLVRHEVFLEVGGYNEKLIYGEDGNLFQKISRKYKTVYLNEFEVWGSAIRFRVYGWLKASGIWLINALWVYLFKKSFIKKWDRLYESEDKK